jgi:uncharacterized protein YbaR (Trm112 family)
MDRFGPLTCTACRAELVDWGDHLDCPRSRKNYPVIDGVPSFVERPSSHARRQEAVWSHEARGASPRASSDKDLFFHLRRERAFLFKTPLREGALILDVGAGLGTTITLVGPGFA